MKVAVPNADKLSDGEKLLLRTGQREVIVCRIRGRYYALDSICPHRGAALGRATLEESTISCPWHEWRFDAVTGQGVTNPHSRLATYEINVEDGIVTVTIPDE